MSMQAEDKPWFSHGLVWMLIAFPASAVIGGFVTLALAVMSDDGLVIDDYYRHGKALNQVLARDERAQALGLEAEVYLDAGRQVWHVTVRGGEGFSLPRDAELAWLHATRPNLDQRVALRASWEGYLEGPATALVSGPWYVQIETGAWRLRTRVVIDELAPPVGPNTAIAFAAR